MNETENSSEITDSLVENVSYLENQNIILQERIEELLSESERSKMIETFQGGKYNDTVREVYALLLSMNVGVNNVDKIVRAVIEKLGGIKVDRLPKKTFSETMLIEAKALAQIQAAEAILCSSNNTIHTDGTKRKGNEFGGVQIGTQSGQYSIGLNELVRGDTDNFIEMMDTIISDMSKLITSNDNREEIKSRLFLSFKNTMTDRHIVNTSVKNKLEKIKLDLLKDSEHSDEVKQTIAHLNGFKCNIHAIVNLASQAETGLKHWEKCIFESLENECTSRGNFSKVHKILLRQLQSFVFLEQMKNLDMVRCSKLFYVSLIAL